MADKIDLLDDFFRRRNEHLFAGGISDDVYIVAAGFDYIHDRSQFAPGESKDVQTKYIVLIVTIRGKFCQLVQRDEQALAAQGLSGIGVINADQLQNDHLSLVGPHPLDFVASMLGAKVDCL